MCKTNEDRLDNLFQIMLAELTDDELDRSKSFSIQRQRSRMRKRAEYIKPELEQQCLDDFVLLNQKVAETRIELPDDIVANASYYITVIFERFNSKLSDLNIQVPLDVSYLLDQWRFGPGASNGVKGTHTAEKISQRMTCTHSSIPLVTTLRRSNYYFSAFDAAESDQDDLYEGSKLTTVPKNEDTVRVIAIEPSGNMALQLAAGQYITDVLSSIGLDISTQQEKNKILAKLASIDNSLATIDLKSASDMFTPELIRLLLPDQWFKLLMQIRSPKTLINGVEHELNMISTMGNGFTFPLMTLCLTSLIYALRCRHKGPNLFIDWTQTAVYGDDVIIKSSEYLEYTTLLKQAGLIVNYDKSYSDGPFRESCGGDYYEGYNVTPFYVRNLSSDPEINVAINQVLEWSERNSMFLPKTLYYLGSLLHKVFFVPEWSNPDQGILTSQVENRYKFYEPERIHKKLKNEFFLMPLAIGGYVFSRGSDILYTPRRFKSRYVVRKGRLPKGFLSGWDPIKRTLSASSTIDFQITLIFREFTPLN